MTPAEEITEAVKTLRSSTFIGVRYSTSTVAALLRARAPLAKLLESVTELHEPNVCGKHEGCGHSDCQWCADEDFPCADMRNALAVARAVLGSNDG